MTFINASEHGEYPQVRDVMWKMRYRRGWGCCLRNSNNSKILTRNDSKIVWLSEGEEVCDA